MCYGGGQKKSSKVLIKRRASRKSEFRSGGILAKRGGFLGCAWDAGVVGSVWNPSAQPCRVLWHECLARRRLNRVKEWARLAGVLEVLPQVSLETGLAGWASFGGKSHSRGSTCR
jgi:hypothetical protein